MKTIYKTVNEMSEEQKQKFVYTAGRLMLWMAEGQSTAYMAEQLNMPPWCVDKNINEMMYVLRNQVGKRKFFETLFVK